MSKQITYKCNLCGEEKDSQEFYAFYWKADIIPQNYVLTKDIDSCDKHICEKCIITIVDTFKDKKTMKNTTIKQVEDYSCKIYDVTMEQVNNKKTRRKNILQARRMIVFLAMKHAILPLGEIMTACNVSSETISRFYLHVEFARYDDVELNSVITGFEKEYIN